MIIDSSALRSTSQLIADTVPAPLRSRIWPEARGDHSVAVVIVNFNADQWLTDCVAGVLKQASQVIVVDNHSSDHSFERLQSKFPNDARLKLLRNQANLGFAVASNRGLRDTREEFVVFLNPDCMPAPDAIDRLTAAMVRNPYVAVAGAHLVNTDGTEQAGGRRAVPTPWRSLVRAFRLGRLAHRWPRVFSDFNLHEQPLPTAPTEVEAVSGACMMVRREAFESVGIWDEGYFLHCEDLDWCMRFRQAGWKILFVPDARVVHIKGGSSADRPLFVEWHKHKGMIRFYNKFFRHQYPGALMWLVTFGVWLRFGLTAAYHLARTFGRGLLPRRV